MNDVDEFDIGAISDIDGTANSVTEDAAVGTVVGLTASAIDPDATNNGVSYSLDDDAGGRFAIDANSGVVTVNAALDYESAATYTIVVRATSTDLSTVTRSFSIAIGDVDEFDVTLVTDSNGASNAVDENAANGMTVGLTAFAADADATTNVISYSLVDDASGRFTINANTGVVTVANGGLLDREAATSHDIIVRATSQDGSTTMRTFTINLGDVDEFDTSSVVDSDGAANGVAENSAFGTVVGLTGFAADADATNNAITYSLDNDAGGRFAIDGLTGVVTVLGGLDYEFATSHAVTIRATSIDGSFQTQSFTISVLPENDNSPVFTSASAFNIAENTTTVGDVAASDADLPNPSVSYSIVGGDDSSQFTLSGNRLRFVSAQNYESPRDFDADNVYEVELAATDGTGRTTNQLVSVSVLDVNEAIIGLTPGTMFVDEFIDTSSGYSVATLSANDLDDNDSHSFQIVGGKDRLKFSIGGANGDQLMLNDGVLDFESEDKYEVKVRATDGAGHTYDRTLKVFVRDLNESPTGISPNFFSVDENTDTTGGFELGRLLTDDLDDDDSFTYSIVGGADSAAFSLTGISGDRLTLNAGVLDHEARASFTVVVRVTDSGGFSFDQAIVVEVADLNEAPVVAGESFSLAEGGNYSVASGWLTVNDSDPEGDSLATTLVIGPQFGSLQLLADGSFSYQHDGSETTTDQFAYEVSDGHGNVSQAWVDITINPVNDLPIARRNTITLNSFEPIVIEPAQLLANDSDAEGALQISLVRAARYGTVSLGTDGKIYYAPNPNIDGVDQFVYQVVDSDGATDFATVSIITPKPVANEPSPTPPADTNQPNPVIKDPKPSGSTPAVGSPVGTLTDSGNDESIEQRFDAQKGPDENNTGVYSLETRNESHERTESSRQIPTVQFASTTNSVFAMDDFVRTTVTVASYDLGVIQNLDNSIYSSAIWRDLQWHDARYRERI